MSTGCDAFIIYFALELPSFSLFKLESALCAHLDAGTRQENPVELFFRPLKDIDKHGEVLTEAA